MVYLPFLKNALAPDGTPTLVGDPAEGEAQCGGQYELVTRSGTNQFHGTLVEYHRDTDTEANGWFSNNDNPVVPRPPLVRNQFGGSIGGPILRDRLFFFFDYNGRRDTLSNVVDQTVPMDSYRNGEVSYINSASAIETLSPAQAAALDPQGIGFNSSLLSLFGSRYPRANDLSGDLGDLINLAGFVSTRPFLLWKTTLCKGSTTP